MKQLKTILTAALLTFGVAFTAQSLATEHGVKNTTEVADQAITSCQWYFLPGFGWVCI